MEQTHVIAWHVPNLLSICIDSITDGEMSGEIYHCYTTEPLKFRNIIRMIETAENFFDQICFPRSSTQMRSFEKQEQTPVERPEKVSTPEEILQKRGKKGTFLLNVKYRQNSSWQGLIQWVEGDVTYQFASVLELLKILSNSVRE